MVWCSVIYSLHTFQKFKLSSSFFSLLFYWPPVLLPSLACLYALLCFTLFVIFFLLFSLLCSPFAVWCAVGRHRWFVLNYVINVGLSGSSQPKLERFHHSLQGYPQAGCARGRIGRWEEREKKRRGWLGTWNNIYKDKENKRGSGRCCQIRHCNRSALRRSFQLICMLWNVRFNCDSGQI